MLTMSVPFVGAVVIVPVVIETEVNAPVEGVVAPTDVLLIVLPVMVALDTVVPLIVPPVIATAFASCVDIVPKPETCVLVIAIGVSAIAVNWPWPFTVAVNVFDAAPYDPAVTAVSAIEIVPVEVIGPPVKPVPVRIDVTPDPDASVVHAPFKYASRRAMVVL